MRSTVTAEMMATAMARRNNPVISVSTVGVCCILDREFPDASAHSATLPKGRIGVYSA